MSEQEQVPTLPPTAHPEEICDDCKGPNIIWHTANELWNRVIRPRGEIEADPMLCPRCFAIRAKKTGVWRYQWRLCATRE